MSGLLLLRPDVLWLLWLRQGWSGGAGAAGETGRNLLLKLPIPKYPDFCENCFLAVQRFPKRMYIGWACEKRLIKRLVHIFGSHFRIFPNLFLPT